MPSTSPPALLSSAAQVAHHLHSNAGLITGCGSPVFPFIIEDLRTLGSKRDNRHDKSAGTCCSGGREGIVKPSFNRLDSVESFGTSSPPSPRTSHPSSSTFVGRRGTTSPECSTPPCRHSRRGGRCLACTSS
ncbi:hypothetical protein BKA70DRAFT_1565053 [Coprinopsis sp. MPI-PUGE-AT-0042]|nr:hypothetical protein BKA70DRAFT_1565053 [Coprinopsis sp. MPI-PUGE-AT-0042]